MEGRGSATLWWIFKLYQRCLLVTKFVTDADDAIRLPLKSEKKPEEMMVYDFVVLPLAMFFWNFPLFSIIQYSTDLFRPEQLVIIHSPPRAMFSDIWHSIFDFQIFDFHGSFFLDAAVLRYLTFKGLTVRFNGNQRDVTLAWKSGTNNKPNFESDFPSVIWVGEAGNRVS